MTKIIFLNNKMKDIYLELDKMKDYWNIKALMKNGDTQLLQSKLPYEVAISLFAKSKIKLSQIHKEEINERTI